MKNLRAFAFDAYGTLFDVFSVTALCDELFPGRGDALAQRWRAKQLQYSLLGSMMHRYRNFWQITGDALIHATKTLNLTLTAASRQRLMDAYLQLSAFPDARPGLEALKKRGLSVAILSNGEPRMLDAAVACAGLGDLIDDIISVDEVKVFKPDPRVYQLVGQRFRRATDEIGFVSSNSWDINGAGAAGLYTVWIRREPEEPEEELGFPAQRILSALTELETVITQDS